MIKNPTTDKHTERETHCDFCSSTNGYLQTVNANGCHRIVAICGNCKKAGILQAIEKDQSVKLYQTPPPSEPKLQRAKLLR